MNYPQIQLYVSFLIILSLIVTPVIMEFVYAFAIYKLGRRPDHGTVGIMYVSFFITWAVLLALIMF
jgi:hypothetical protein